ncbi:MULTISPECIES: type II secretion system F family protein [Streptomyces]|uniref:type II secretion system F family protein n=1 Tax=Streptomyces TaxID=1883 RepID=UPI00103D4FD3|nr:MULTISPECIES: type II secretion system F family protein [Streptomyces]MBT3077352.1 type II secretion system F family protein [Streptomyces sp. COG21]MBT3082673.1 type II secretion system F family protein [Streptomyces sp. COG20]MBT3087493.1 type II secretion system F family protein [Streptomyces sp. CYG21]MBT3097475.1 type II secretion system F family protein [Streptomyces sp. CBG30]MBT3104647.1 type II secretion system F family protein [Streptomyces sp. COG19]
MAVALAGAAVQLAIAVTARHRGRTVRGRGAVLLDATPAPGAGWWSLAAVVRDRAGSGVRAGGGARAAGGSGAGAGGGADAGPVAGSGLGAWGRPRVGLWAAPVGAWLAGWVLVGGLLGCAVGSAVAYGTWRWQRSRPRPGPGETREEQAAIAGQLPLAADLLAACVAVGAGPREAAEAVGESIGGPVGDRLARAAAEIRLGGEPADAWGRLGEIPGAGPLARCLHRAGSTGAPAAEPVSRLAEAMRAERAGAAVARAQRAGVLITAPVGLCFLPAFLAVGVAPVIIGLAGGLLAAD